MPSQEQVDELESLEAFYSGSEAVMLRLPEQDELSSSENVSLSAVVCAEDFAEADVRLRLDLSLPPDYPDGGMPPVFTLVGENLALEEVSLLCRQLDELWEADAGTPVLITWFEWLRMEAGPRVGGHGDSRVPSDARATAGQVEALRQAPVKPKVKDGKTPMQNNKKEKKERRQAKPTLQQRLAEIRQQRQVDEAADSIKDQKGATFVQLFGSSAEPQLLSFKPLFKEKRDN